MSDPIEDIKDLTAYFNEIDYRFQIVKLSKKYKRWHRKPIASGTNSESKRFKLILWPGTIKQQIVFQSIQKYYYEDRPLSRKLKELIKIEELEQCLKTCKI